MTRTTTHPTTRPTITTGRLTRTAALSRRELFAALPAAALPFLAPLRAHAAEAPVPRNLIFFFTANGTIPEAWRPTGTETAWTTSRILQPLADAHKNELIVLNNLDKKTGGPGDAHMHGVVFSLAAAELAAGTQFRCAGTMPCAGWGTGQTVDQVIAGRLAVKTRFPSLELGVQTGGANIFTRIAYKGREEPLPPESDPYKLHERVFSALDVAGADQAAKDRLERLRGQRKSVLDYVSSNVAGVRDRLGGEDKRRLQAHFEALREVEKELDDDLGGPMMRAPACAKPDLGARFDVMANDNFPRAGKAQMDLLVMALACGLTRVSTMIWDGGVSGKRFTWLGVGDGHHDLSHRGDGDAGAKESLTKINIWYAEQMAYLVDRLKKVPVGTGSLLDHTAVVWVNELGKGNSHANSNTPFVVAGGKAGGLRGGRFIDCKKDSHARLLVSMGQFMGVEMATFGDPKYGGTGPLPGLI